ncbi:MAG: tyrosine-type recombinase/integrase [Thermoanaerobaculia bacterium]|nr:tyrosine-type recombinase/integrase [Thermoanaerobaculia bacterium]
MTEEFYSAPSTLAELHAGPLGSHVDAFAALLSERGYTRSTGRRQLRLVADLSHWLEGRGLGIADLDEEKIAESLKHSPRSRDFIGKFQAVFGILLEHLRRLGFVPMPKPRNDNSAMGCLLRAFEQYLVKERGLYQHTIDQYLRWVRRFLAERFPDETQALTELCSADARKFVLRHAHIGSQSRATHMTSALRGFFRFLLLSGAITTDLAAAVPSVARWRLSSLPKSLEPGQVELLLKSCNRSHAAGQRDYAIILLLARLGLRGGEVVAMQLEDINWKAGELTVRGRGLLRDRMPLPHDVGEAVATYLHHGRPQCPSRRVFVHVQAPYRGFAASFSISSLIRRALRRAGIHSHHKGAHLLRHTLATEMLGKGALMTEISQVLRHRSPSTTEIYAKVDLTALRGIAQPWPGGEA